MNSQTLGKSIAALLLCLVTTGCIFTWIRPNQTSEKQNQPHSVLIADKNTVPRILGMRKFPYPYQAMLAIASDADHETLRKFNLIHEFLNTKEMTPVGPGLGLDISDSFFMYNGTNETQFVDQNQAPMADEFTYFKGVSNQPYGANIINHYIHIGWLDSIHTFGDFSQVNPNQTLFSRNLAKQALTSLEQSGDHVTVWIDHGNQSNVDNFGNYGHGAFYNYQQGANPTSPYYHTDLTIPYGIHFVWADEPNNQFGMSSVIYPILLPDGQHIWGFLRYTDAGRVNHRVEWLWNSNMLYKQLSPVHLQELERNHGYVIIAQHLCAQNTAFPLPQSAVDAFRLLAEQYDKGNILVARTSRLLNYNVIERYLSYTVTYANNKAYIHVGAVHDPVFGTYTPTINDLRGITFYTTNPEATVIELGDTPIENSLIQYNRSDGNHPSIGIRWFESDTTNYAMTAPSVF